MGGKEYSWSVRERALDNLKGKKKKTYCLIKWPLLSNHNMEANE